MATTNWTTAASFQAECPHTFNALQHLVMAMADLSKNRGMKSIFGKDKGLAALEKFESKLADTLLALVLDGAIDRDEDPTSARETLLNAIGMFQEAFPNWQDAYSFAQEYFVGSAATAEARIAATLS